jgi:hypothetical protein
VPGNPLGIDGDYSGNDVMGVEVGRNLAEQISSTGYTGDQPPYCGLIKAIEEGEGLARIAYYYLDHSQAPNDSTMGVALTTLTKNVVNLAVDWRHWTDMERLLRAIFDYVEKNGGVVVPIELTNFDAIAIGKQVDVIWATASELNSARFEVEKASISNAGRSEFVKIDEVAAAGKSGKLKEYGPVTDYNVEYGRTYAYRLKMIDNNGASKYSEVKTVTIGDAEGGISLSEPIPNPASELVSFNLNLGTGMNLTIAVFDVNGKQVETVFTGTKAIGSHDIEVDLSRLSSGLYTLVLKSGEVFITRSINVVTVG